VLEKAEELGVALLERAAVQGHVHAMYALGSHLHEREEHEQAVRWLTTAAEAGLPYAMFNLGTLLDEGKGVAAPDYQAAAGWFMRAADAGRSGVYGVAAHNLCNMYTAGRGRGSVRTSTRPTLNR